MTICAIAVCLFCIPQFSKQAPSDYYFNSDIEEHLRYYLEYMSESEKENNRAYTLLRIKPITTKPTPKFRPGDFVKFVEPNIKPRTVHNGVIFSRVPKKHGEIQKYSIHYFKGESNYHNIVSEDQIRKYQMHESLIDPSFNSDINYRITRTYDDEILIEFGLEYNGLLEIQILEKESINMTQRVEVQDDNKHIPYHLEAVIAGPNEHFVLEGYSQEEGRLKIWGTIEQSYYLERDKVADRVPYDKPKSSVWLSIGIGHKVQNQKKKE